MTEAPRAAAAVPDITFAPNQGEQVDVGAKVTDKYVVSRGQITSDGGATWRPFPTESDWGVVSTTHFFTRSSTGKALAYPLAGGEPLGYTTTDSPQSPWGARVVLGGQVVDMATQKVLLPEVTQVEGMGPGGVASVTGSWVDGTYQRVLAIHAWTGSRIAQVDLPPILASSVAGDQYRFVTASDTEWRYCVVPLATGALSCRKVSDRTTAQSDGGRVIMGGNDTAAVIVLGPETRRAVMVEGEITKVITSDAELYPLATPGGGRPVVRVGDLQRVAADGTFSPVAKFPIGPIRTLVLGLTPGRIVTLDRSDDPDAMDTAAWNRSVGSTQVGAQTKLPVRATLNGVVRSSTGTSWLSGLRTLIRTATDLVLLDRDKVVRRGLDGRDGAVLSGPYYLAHSGDAIKVVDVTGKDYGITGHAIFGSRVATITSAGVTVTDVAKSTSPFKTLPVGGSVFGYPRIYGDWVAWAEVLGAGTPTQTSSTVAHNLKTGQKLVRPAAYQFEALVGAMGDGYVSVGNGVWRFADNSYLETVNEWGQHDGAGRIALEKDGEIHIQTIDGVGTSPARVLGVIAPAGLDVSKAGAVWAPEVDSTKGIKAGVLEIRNASNVVVREVVTPASETGGLRGVGWDGKTGSGVLVPDGTYTWTLRADSADGTGALTAIDGTSAVSGSVTVTGSTGFTDVDPSTGHYEHIMWLASRGVTTGYGDGTFRPVQPVNRDAMAAFMYRLAGSPAFDPQGRQTFVDVTPTTAFYKEIEWLASRGISTGWDTTEGKVFRPVQPVNRDAMAAFLYRLYGSPAFTAPGSSPFVDVPVGAQFYKEMSWLAAQGISKGWDDGTFRPLTSVNRDAMAAFMHRGFDKFGVPRG